MRSVAVCVVAALLALVALSSAKPFAGTAPGSFDHIFVMQFENEAYSKVMKDPNFSKYAKMGTLLTNYKAITHPSQPNYWSQVAGSYFGINSDDTFNLTGTNLVDLFDRKGISWKTYQEAYPGGCNGAGRIGTYWRKHNPFISFDNVRNNATRCANIVNSAQLDRDLAAGTLPQYSYYTPDINNDGHDTGLAFAGKYLDSFLAPRLAKFPQRTLIVITWDEDDYRHNNQVYAALLGSVVQAGATDNTSYNHFSLLRTIEDNWQLGDLGRGDAVAQSFGCFV